MRFIFFILCFNYVFSFDFNNIIHQNSYQRAYKRLAKISFIVDEWQHMDVQQMQKYKDLFAKRLWKLSLNYFFYTKQFIKENRTKMDDFINMYKLVFRIIEVLNSLNLPKEELFVGIGLILNESSNFLLVNIKE